MTVRVREELGLPVPDRRQVRQMLVWAGRRERRLLASMLKVHTYRINSAEPGSFWIRLTKPLYGVCVCVENGMLYVDHEQGVRWTRLDCVLHHTQFDWRHWQ